MAKFSMNSTFLLLAVFAFIVHGHIVSGAESAKNGSSGGDGAGGASSGSGGSEGGNKFGELLNKGGFGSLTSGSGGSKEEGNVDPATKFKNVLNKFLLVLQSYTSKELGPELKNAAIKLIQFVLHYWAQQKPEEMQKFNSFLETSAKATSGALSKSSGGSSGDSSSSSGGSSQA